MQNVVEVKEVDTLLCPGRLHKYRSILPVYATYKTSAAPAMVSSAPRMAPYAREDAVALPSAAGGAAPLAVGEELPDAVLVAEPDADPLPDSVAEGVDGDEEPVRVAVLLLRLDASEDRDVAEDDRAETGTLVEMRLSVELVEGARELDDEGSSSRSTTILISVHCSPIDSSYRLPNAPLMHRHHLVVPPIARELFLHIEKPPV